MAQGAVGEVKKRQQTLLSKKSRRIVGVEWEREETDTGIRNHLQHVHLQEIPMVLPSREIKEAVGSEESPTPEI